MSVCTPLEKLKSDFSSYRMKSPTTLSLPLGAKTPICGDFLNKEK